MCGGKGASEEGLFLFERKRSLNEVYGCVPGGWFVPRTGSNIHGFFCTFNGCKHRNSGHAHDSCRHYE
jgi:hypothetical protein